MSKSKQKILIFSELFYPSQTTTAYYITKIANLIAKQSKKQVHVFCATKKETQEKEYAFENNLSIHRIDNGKGNKNKLVARIIKFVRITLKFCIAIALNARSNDILFSITNPAFIIPVCALFKKVFHYKYVLLAYDVFPENLVAADLIKKHSLLYKLTKIVFDWSYCRADIVISIGRDMTEILKQKGISDDHIILIQNWASTEQIIHSSKTDNQIIKEYNLENKIVFLFAGNFGRVQGIPELLNVIDHVCSDNAAFLFVGDGAMRRVILEYQKTHPQKAIFCHPFLPMDQQNIFLNACDIAIVTLNKKMLGLGVPSKSYYSLASGHPILFIGDKHSEVAAMLEDGECGWQASFEDIDKCAKLIDSLCSKTHSEIGRMGHNAWKYLHFHFSEKVILDKYSQLFMRLYQ